ncbi:biotin-dependent carboxyltransferase family protein [Nocardiopsis sp. CNT-189]|uniref:5-oxoprolinase subunit C family protein n=1 Tax=Nocardiopsis oceanisediminis TaxID=2816862 RepID=UPI003B3AE393
MTATMAAPLPGAGAAPAEGRGGAALEVLAPGPFATVQDGGRPGRAALGVGASGAADRASYGLANRLLANPEGAPAVEATLGGLELRARGDLWVAVTGAECAVTAGGRGGAMNTVLRLRDGERLRLGTPDRGLRSYVAVRGGVAVRPVLGSCSTDVLAGLGPDPLAPGDLLPVGPPPAAAPVLDAAPAAPVGAGSPELRVVLGPRDAWFAPEAVRALLGADFEVTVRSDRVGMRLAGPPLPRAVDGELPSEGMVPGALQVPPDGEPVLFLADHPVTGGYPVIAVVLSADLPAAAQARPGTRLRFRAVRP